MLHEAEAHLKAVIPEQATLLQKFPVAEGEEKTTVRLSKCKHGGMLYFPHDFYIGGSLEKYGEYNHDEAEMLHRYINEGNVVVEVGANIGTHTVPIARWVGEKGRVLAFEPQRVLFQMMCGNLAINALWNVYAVQEALSDHTGTIAVPPVNYAESGNFGAVELGSGTDVVATRTLDSVNLPRCDLIKVDVEGMELEVLQGAINTINKFRPVLYVENDRKDKARELIELIHSFGYRLWWHLPPLFSSSNFREDLDNIFGEVVSLNMLCLPEGMEAPVGLTEVELPALDAVDIPKEEVKTSGLFGVLE